MDYLDLFNAQLRVLKDSDYSHLLLRQLENQQIGILAKASQLLIPDNHLPFLPVLPKTAFRFSALMPRVLNFPNFGDVFFIKPKYLVDTISAPSEDPYYIFGVDNGILASCGRSPKQTKEAAEAIGRRGLTFLEGLALFMHCGDLPDNYCLWTWNSQLRFGNQTYYVALMVKNRKLHKMYYTPNHDPKVPDLGLQITPSVLP